jgi:hypothetical protein
MVYAIHLDGLVVAKKIFDLDTQRDVVRHEMLEAASDRRQERGVVFRHLEAEALGLRPLNSVKPPPIPPITMAPAFFQQRIAQTNLWHKGPRVVFTDRVPP